MGMPLINPAEFLTFVLVLIRISMILFLAPIFGSAVVPAQIKIALALVLAFVLTPIVQIDVTVYPETMIGFVPLLLGEIFLGLVLAMLVRLILEGVQFAGQFIGFQMGFAIVNVIDPQSGAQMSVLAQFAYILALLVFLAANGHHIIIKALADSFELAPPGLIQKPMIVLREVLQAVSGMFVIAVKIAAPTLGVLFCAKVAMGIVSKTVPQMNVLFVGMPLYIVVGLFIFGLSITFMVPILGRAVADVNRTIFNLLKAM
jgi:flagellar biosynthesis protein FliR